VEFIFIFRREDKEWDVYELYHDEEGYVCRTREPVMCLEGETPSHLGLLLSDMKDSFKRGNYFESLKEMESTYE